MKYRRKPIIVDVMKFYSDNEPDNKNMNEIVEWIKSNNVKARHNGTNIFIGIDFGELIASCGDYIIKWGDGSITSRSSKVFEKEFEPIVD